jgi:hypothetical protein
LREKEVVLNHTQGAFIMAGQTLGALAPNASAHLMAPHCAAPRTATSTRTRRNHGVFMLADELASVYSSRRMADELGASMAVGCGSLVLTGSMTPSQSRAMAGTLISAARASEAVGGAA